MSYRILREVARELEDAASRGDTGWEYAEAYAPAGSIVLRLGRATPEGGEGFHAIVRAATPCRDEMLNAGLGERRTALLRVLEQSIELTVNLEASGWRVLSLEPGALTLYKPARNAQEAAEAIAGARRAAGLQDPLTLGHLSGDELRVYKALATMMGEQAIQAAQVREAPEEGVGWVSVAEVSRRAGVERRRTASILGVLLYLGYAEWRDGAYRAAARTGAFLEALSWLPEPARWLLRPYVLGYSVVEWTALEEPSGEAEGLVEAVRGMELAGVGLVGPLL